MGRPMQFEPDDALNAIKNVFWQKGYEGTSMKDIEKVSGINKQSLYRLFGDKRTMYLRALNHYEQQEANALARLLKQPGSARQRFRQLFEHIINYVVETGDRRGCLLCNASVDQAQLDSPTRDSIEAAMARLQQGFSKALEESEYYRRSAAKRDAKAAALMASYFGLRVLIKANASENMLRNVATDAVESI